MSNETQQVIALLILIGFFVFSVRGCVTEDRLISKACSEPTSQACANLTKPKEEK